MAYQTGIAQNERDFLRTLNRFLTADATLTAAGQNWQMLYERTLPATATTVEQYQVVWKSSGTGVSQDMYICAESKNAIAEDTYNINFYGGTFFNPALMSATTVTSAMVGCSPGVGLCCDARAFEYHLIADGRCCKIACFIGEVCTSAYLGFMLPTVTPVEYPYPLLIAATTSAEKLTRYSLNNGRVSSIVDPRNNNCYLLGVDQAWHLFSGATYELNGGGRTQLVLPKGGEQNVTLSANTLAYLGASPGGHYPLFPAELLSTEASAMGASRWGAMQGVYWVPGIGLLPGDKIRIADSGHRGIVFNNGFRRSTTDYFVLDTGLPW